MPRDDFPKETVDALSKRVACRCSNPDCRRITTGPHTDAAKWVNVGVAAHVTAAAPGGPRYDLTLSAEQRKSAENGLWLCQDCAKTIDSDPASYPVPLLVQWKSQAEADTDRCMRDGRPLVGSDLPLAVSVPILVGSTPSCLVGEEQIAIAPLEHPEDDPAFYVSAFVFRTVVQSAVPGATVVVQGFGADVLKVEPIPSYRPLYGAYPTSLSLYRLEFDNPVIAGTNRFLAPRYFSPRTDGRSEERAFQPVALDPVLPETFDIRLTPKSPGLFTLRVFALVSVGVKVSEQPLIRGLRLVVPPPIADE